METLDYKNHQGEDKRITLVKEIGKGAFGTVYESLLEGYGLVAVKSQKVSQRILEELETEARLIPMLKKYAILLKKILLNPIYKSDKTIALVPEPYVSFSDTISPEKVYAVYELVDGLSLQKIIQINKDTGVSITKIVLNRYINDLLQGVLEMKNAGVVHRDIKPANIMLSRGTLKYIDFGMTCFSEDCEGLKGSPNFLSPEAYKKARNIDWHLLDIFALGVTIMVMITGIPIWAGAGFKSYNEIAIYCRNTPYKNMEPIFARGIMGAFKKFKEYEEYEPLIIGMTQPDPESRPSIGECIEFFDKLEKAKFLVEV
jgi:serine/threonine protein kinase